jgi:hypothetical protein
MCRWLAARKPCHSLPSVPKPSRAEAFALSAAARNGFHMSRAREEPNHLGSGWSDHPSHNKIGLTSLTGFAFLTITSAEGWAVARELGNEIKPQIDAV